MITFKKSQGVQKADIETCKRIQEVVLDAQQQIPVGSVMIDAEKITFYKFGLKMGITRHSTAGIVYTNGELSYAGLRVPQIKDIIICTELFKLFNLIVYPNSTK